MEASPTRPERRRVSYGVIFLGLVVLTVIELGVSALRVPAPLSTR